MSSHNHSLERVQLGCVRRTPLLNGFDRLIRQTLLVLGGQFDESLLDGILQ